MGVGNGPGPYPHQAEVDMSVITKASDKGAEFIAGHEGFVSKTYLCPAGVMTIGFGFTMGSKVFAAYWKAKTGRALRMGDTMTEGEAIRLLPKVIDEEYGKAVASKIKPTKQHHYDGASSVAFNCGTGSLSWRWAVALAQGKANDAASLLRTTATTANGRVLDGLIRRRQAEARLIATGDYGHPNEGTSVSQSVEAIKELQKQLKTLGLYTGNIDGSSGPLTLGAVKNFQRTNGLKVDGVVGPATRAALVRALDVKATKDLSVVGGTGGGIFGADALPWDSIINIGATAALIVTVITVGSYVWRNRGKITGARVPT
jgi:lysozyme